MAVAKAKAKVRVVRVKVGRGKKKTIMKIVCTPSKRKGRPASKALKNPRKCGECAEKRMIKARNLRHKCYDYARRHGSLDDYGFSVWGTAEITCKSCGQVAHNAGHGYCNNCYYREHPRRTVTCGGCGKRKPHRAIGLCNACYQRTYSPRKIRCPDCKTMKPIHAQGLCHACYHRRSYWGEWAT